MRRTAISLVATVVGLVLLLSYKTHSGASILRPAALAPATTSPPTPTPSVSGSAKTKTKTAASRSVDGQAIDTRYGVVQVRVTEQSGQIVSVTPLQLPQQSGRDIEIDNFAVPQLIQETLSAQSAHIDMVSGATYTSDGYVQSLQSALDQF